MPIAPIVGLAPASAVAGVLGAMIVDVGCYSRGAPSGLLAAERDQ